MAQSQHIASTYIENIQHVFREQKPTRYNNQKQISVDTTGAKPDKIRSYVSITYDKGKAIATHKQSTCLPYLYHIINQTSQAW